MLCRELSKESDDETDVTLPPPTWETRPAPEGAIQIRPLPSGDIPEPTVIQPTETVKVMETVQEEECPRERSLVILVLLKTPDEAKAMGSDVRRFLERHLSGSLLNLPVPDEGDTVEAVDHPSCR